jgi:excisionase family DNA binding protein
MYPTIESESNPINLEVLLRGEDVARILNISRGLAYQLIQRGEIPAVRIGRAVRVRPADLDAFITRNLSVTGTPFQG